MSVVLSQDLTLLFPAGVIGAELRGPGEPAQLLPAEAAATARMAPGRAREFAAGRMCARRALAEFGIVDFPLLRAPDRQPVWPEGIVGSITHTDGYCAAVVARRSEFLGLGIDSEVVGAVGEHLWPKIATTAERAWLAELPAAKRPQAATLLFSAKEAFYKLRYSAIGERYDFKDVEVRADCWGSERKFEITLSKEYCSIQSTLAPLSGRYAIVDSIIVTSLSARPANH